MKTILIIILIVVVLTIIFIIQKKARRNKLLELTKQRKRFTKTDFIKYFELKGFREDNISFIYDEIFKFIELKDFSLMPNDNLHEICGFIDLDDVEFVGLICSKIGINIPSQSSFDILNEKYINFTPEYLFDLIKDNKYKPVANM